MPRQEDQAHKLLTHLREVLAEQKRVEGDDDLDVEALVLLAKGRLDALPARERKTLLRRIAHDPDAADLLRELVQIRPVPPWYRAMLRRASGFACLLAGVVTVTLGAWRIADPPTGSYLDGMTAGDAPAALAWVSQDQMRARVMFASATLWLIFSLIRHWPLPADERPLPGPARRSILARSREPTTQFASDRG